MSKSDANFTIAPLLRRIYALAAVVVIAGAGLYFLPGLLVPIWPWPLAPFNTRFLGTIYTVELIALAITVVVNQWAPTRLVLWISSVFVVLVTLVSFFYLDRFDSQKLTTWLWFVLYTGSAAGLVYYLWYYRNRPPADPRPIPPRWRTYLFAEAAVYGLYGLGLLAAPALFGSFWPWKIDSFHAQIYSAIFLALATGSLVLSRAAAPIEFLTMGVSQLAFGVLAILGLILVDASVRRVNWSSPGTWLWVAGLLVLALAGAAMIRRASLLGHTISESSVLTT
ncbi:MAG: hypothetical protein ACJ78Q_07095 [Chloroflexia bacterium]